MPRRSQSGGGQEIRGIRPRRSTPTPTLLRRRRYGDGSVQPPAAHWDGALGEYLLNWDDVRASADPHAAALEFAQSAFTLACEVCRWDNVLVASAHGTPPPVH